MTRKPRGRAVRSSKLRKATAKSSGGSGSRATLSSAAIYRKNWLVLDPRKLVAGTSQCTGLTVEHQQQTNWCWAAVSNSVSRYYDPSSTWSQCTIANAELGHSSCCTNGGSAACNQPWFLDRALTRVGCLL